MQVDLEIENLAVIYTALSTQLEDMEDILNEDKGVYSEEQVQEAELVHELSLRTLDIIYQHISKLEEDSLDPNIPTKRPSWSTQ